MVAEMSKSAPKLGSKLARLQMMRPLGDFADVKAVSGRGRPKKVGKPWEAAGISRSEWYRRAMPRVRAGDE
jgi:hypothetical protein